MRTVSGKFSVIFLAIIGLGGLFDHGLTFFSGIARLIALLFLFLFYFSVLISTPIRRALLIVPNFFYTSKSSPSHS